MKSPESARRPLGNVTLRARRQEAVGSTRARMRMMGEEQAVVVFAV